jgi:hypothetical protein
MLNLSFCPKTCNGQNKEIKSLKINQLLSSSHTSRKSRESQLLSAKLVDAIPLGTENTNKYRNVKISSKVPKNK